MDRQTGRNRHLASVHLIGVYLMGVHLIDVYFMDVEQRCTSDLELSPCKRSFIDISHLSASSLKNLKRFARRGGPSLVDLGGVSQATVRWEDECLYENLSVSGTITSVLKDHELSRVQLPGLPRGGRGVEQVQ
jgi:hypothetical protein